jgi:hypothetical protein
METIFSILVGLGLAAAVGFRIFVPFLVMSVAATTGHLPLAEGFEWIGTTPALIALAFATGLELSAYYVPWLDNALDVIAGPATVVAGILVTASVVTDVSPFARWSLAVIAGGGIAGTLQGGSVLARAASTATTGGVGNFAVSTLELAGSLVTSTLAILWPILVVPLLAILFFVSLRTLRRRRGPATLS